MVLEAIPPDILAFATSFLFIFAVVFGLLVYTKIFKETRAVPAVIAVVFGIIASLYAPFVIFLQAIIPFAAIILVLLFFIIFLRTLLGGGGGKKRIDPWPAVVSLGISLILLGIFWDQLAGYFGLTIRESENLLLLAGVVIIIAIFYIAYRVGTGVTTGQSAQGGRET